MSLRLSCLALCLAAAACGGGGDDGPDIDAALDPTRVVLTAWEETGDQVFTERTLDTSCLNTPTDDVVRTEPGGTITLNTSVTDFMSGADVAAVTVTAFAGVDQADVLGTGTSDANGMLSIDIDNHATEPRIGFRMEGDPTDYFTTFLLQQYIQPTGSPQTSPSEISIVSTATGAALPALVGVTRSPNTGVLAGAIRDCMGNEIAGFNATVSSVSGQKMPLANARTFYFGENGLPARNTVQAIGNKNGLFVVLELPVTTTAYVQMWGYLNAADLAAGTETLLSELAVPVIADNIITGSYELNRN